MHVCVCANLVWDLCSFCILHCSILSENVVGVLRDYAMIHQPYAQIGCKALRFVCNRLKIIAHPLVLSFPPCCPSPTPRFLSSPPLLACTPPRTSSACDGAFSCRCFNEIHTQRFVPPSFDGYLRVVREHPMHRQREGRGSRERERDREGDRQRDRQGETERGRHVDTCNGVLAVYSDPFACSLC